MELYVDEGDRVVKGQALALMDDGDLTDRIQEAQANLRSAQAEQRRSASELRRNEPLYREGAISFDDLERFRAEDQVRLMAVNAARERLQQRQVEARELIVRAPFDGVISQRFADPGSFVTPPPPPPPPPVPAVPPSWNSPRVWRCWPRCPKATWAASPGHARQGEGGNLPGSPLQPRGSGKLPPGRSRKTTSPPSR
jgi:pyruvate/2-oxoglutarate dehydrogenase complex dihydrolipoamide acyltransferase (E2) component